MRTLIDPSTGDMVRCSNATAERLLADGYVDPKAASAGGEQDERPAKSASRDDWNAYAESLGLDPEDYSSKDELIAAVDDAEGDQA